VKAAEVVEVERICGPVIEPPLLEDTCQALCRIATRVLSSILHQNNQKVIYVKIQLQ
jgi:hypothetical protein